MSACRDAPFSGIYFPVFAAMKKYHQHNEEQGRISHKSQGILLTKQSEMKAGASMSSSYAKALKLFLASTIAGVAASALTTPADVIKTRLQVRNMG